MQQYILGIRNRLKYSNLLNYSNFNSEELLVHVTNTSRAKESSFIQILGMFKPFLKISENDKLVEKISNSNIFYYPPNYNVWNNKSDNIYKKIITEAELSIKFVENIDKNYSNSNKSNDSKMILTEEIFNLEKNNEKYNINFNYTPYLENRTFFMLFNCLNYENYIKYKYQNKIIEFIKENFENKYGEKMQSFFKYKEKEWLYDYNNAIMIIDNFISNYYNERNLSYFLENTGIDKNEYYQNCMNFSKWWLNHIFCDSKTCILESQKLMEDLIGYFDNKINNKTSKLNMVIDLGHDFTVGPMELFMHETFDVDYSICYFSCNVYFELYKEDNNKKEVYIVKYYVDEDLRLSINYEEFRNKIISKIWNEKEKDEFCNGNILKVLYPKTFIFCIILIIAIIIGAFILVSYKCYNKYKRKRNKNLNNKKHLKEKNENEKELKFLDE